VRVLKLHKKSHAFNVVKIPKMQKALYAFKIVRVSKLHKGPFTFDIEKKIILKVENKVSHRSTGNNEYRIAY
jgi:hypothetical protein